MKKKLAYKLHLFIFLFITSMLQITWAAM